MHQFKLTLPWQDVRMAVEEAQRDLCSSAGAAVASNHSDLKEQLGCINWLLGPMECRGWTESRAPQFSPEYREPDLHESADRRWQQVV